MCWFRLRPGAVSPGSACGESQVGFLVGLDPVALDAVGVRDVVVCWFEVPGVVGSAAGVGDDVVDGVGSGFAADVADVGGGEDASVTFSDGSGVGGAGHRYRVLVGVRYVCS